MKKSLRAAAFALAICAAVPAVYSQSVAPERFAVKAHASLGLGNAMNTNSTLPTMSGKTVADDYGLDFGWTFWRRGGSTFELNLGAGYNNTSTNFQLGKLNYDYGTTVDGVGANRYYQLNWMTQKANLGRITVPVYVTYAYGLSSIIGVHADLGVQFGFRTSTGTPAVTGDGTTYAMFDATGEEFGRTSFDLAEATVAAPQAAGFSAAVMAGIGAEFRIYGPLAFDVTFRYYGGVTNLYKGQLNGDFGFTPSTAPVAVGADNVQNVKPLTDYLTSSKLNQFSIDLSLVYRF